MEIIHHKHFREVRKFSFCYLCGKPLKTGDDVNRDHVPPKGLFLDSDRSCPLILPTHYECNNNKSWSDEIVGQLIMILNRQYPKKKNIKIRTNIYQNINNSQPILALEGINLKGFIARCIKAFHAALYNDFFPDETPNWIDSPLLRGDLINGNVTLEQTLAQFPLFVEIIKKNRKAGRIDRLVCYNGKCVYECVWEQTDDGAWFCLFGLNIYDWKNLGDPIHHTRRGCVGFYMPKSGKPKTATKGIIRVLEIPIRNFEPLDPFGC